MRYSPAAELTNSCNVDKKARRELDKCTLELLKSTIRQKFTERSGKVGKEEAAQRTKPEGIRTRDKRSIRISVMFILILRFILPCAKQSLVALFLFIVPPY